MAHFPLSCLKPRLIIILLSVCIFVSALFTSGIRTFWAGQASNCGNGIVNTNEQCDDGNTNNYDGCSVGCTILTGWVCMGSTSVCHKTCGNGKVEQVNGEQCDDQNDKNGDGCSRSCKLEKGFVCTGECHCAGPAKTCDLFSCGNGIMNPGEQCDDGNMRNGDGCTDGCSVETGFACSKNNPSVCSKDITAYLERLEKLKKGVQ